MQTKTIITIASAVVTAAAAIVTAVDQGKK